MHESDELKVSVRIKASPAEVSPYLVDSAMMIEWIGSWADLHPEPGGLFALNVNGTPVRGEFVLVEPPNRVVFTWGVAGSDDLPEGSTTVEIVLTADGPETIVELTHRDLSSHQLPNHRVGWTDYLGVLRAKASRQ